MTNLKGEKKHLRIIHLDQDIINESSSFDISHTFKTYWYYHLRGTKIFTCISIEVHLIIVYILQLPLGPLPCLALPCQPQQQQQQGLAATTPASPCLQVQDYVWEYFSVSSEDRGVKIGQGKDGHQCNGSNYRNQAPYVLAALIIVFWSCSDGFYYRINCLVWKTVKMFFWYFCNNANDWCN